MNNILKSLTYLILITFGFAVFSQNAKLKNFTQKIYVVGVGQARISYRYFGEPISRPAKFEVFMTCLKSKQERQVKVFDICSWEDYHYEPTTKTLVLKLISGRVQPDTGQVECDQVDDEEIDLDIC